MRPSLHASHVTSCVRSWRAPSRRSPSTSSAAPPTRRRPTRPRGAPPTSASASTTIASCSPRFARAHARAHAHAHAHAHARRLALTHTHAHMHACMPLTELRRLSRSAARPARNRPSRARTPTAASSPRLLPLPALFSLSSLPRHHPARCLLSPPSCLLTPPSPRKKVDGVTAADALHALKTHLVPLFDAAANLFVTCVHAHAQHAHGLPHLGACFRPSL